ncbi:hypothetical protein T02_13223 [Trichinella nativa]|uniref:Uncharacterized protein n=1 Tax=Trichinella nativa TaxID=6335 RepID=A0A0V1L9V6_9BILA|nr:hypothetical protein T02_13223 [Trichinella nativa]
MQDEAKTMSILLFHNDISLNIRGICVPMVPRMSNLRKHLRYIDNYLNRVFLCASLPKVDRPSL